MKLRLAALAGAGLLGAAALAGPGLAGPEFRNKYDSTTATRDCGDGDTVTYTGPLKMWPPNHKLQNVSVLATAGDDTDEVTLTISPAVTDVAGGDGGPNHDPDYQPDGLADSGTGSAEVPFWLRAERSGKGDGRTYTISWVAEFGEKTCASGNDASTTEDDPFVVTVPHDMAGGADWK